MQNLTGAIALTADSKISAQKWQRHTTAADGSNQPLPLRPVRTLLPAGSGPLPTPHAVPHQSPPMQSSGGPRVSSGGSSSSSSDAGAPEASSGSSAVSYSHVIPYVAKAAEDSSSTAAGAARPLIGGGGGGPPASGSPRQGRRSGPVQRRTSDQV